MIHIKILHWLGDIDQLKSLVSELFVSSGKWSSPGGYAKSFRNDKISVTWYSNNRTLVFNGVLGGLFKKLITDLLNNGCSKDAAISNVDASNCSSKTNNVDYDVNGVFCIDNHKDQPNEVLAKSLEDAKMSACLNNCNNCSDRLQEFESVGLQVAGLHKQVASPNRVIDRVNTVLESVCRIVIPNEGLYFILFVN